MGMNINGLSLNPDKQKHVHFCFYIQIHFVFRMYIYTTYMLSLPVVTMTDRLHPSNEQQRCLFKTMLVLLNNIVSNASLFPSLSIMTERWL